MRIAWATVILVVDVVAGVVLYRAGSPTYLILMVFAITMLPLVIDACVVLLEPKPPEGPPPNCPKCGYSLYQCSEPRCPECGESFDAQSLRAAEGKRDAEDDE